MEKNKLIFGTGVSASKDYDSLLCVVREAVKNNILAFDTAPSYKTESILGKTLHQVMNEFRLPRSSFFIQTKIDAWQMQRSDGEIFPYVNSVLSSMGFDYLDSLLIHWPLPEVLESTWKSFVKLQGDGVVKKIGICNVRMRHLKLFSEWDVKPQIIQIELNPLRTCAAERLFCKDHGIELQAYSPLCKMDERIRDSSIIADIASKYNKSVGQIVLRWHIDNNIVPVFTSTKPQRIQEYAAIDDFTLTPDEIAAISSLNENYKMYLESWSCPGL